MQKKALMLMISSLILAGNGCSLLKEKPPVEKLIYVTTPVELPGPRPELPTWTGKDMECLAPEVKQKIRDRDRLRREYAERLEVVIQSTHTK